MIALKVSNVSKTFVMHLQGGVRLPVVDGLSFEVEAGQCVALAGPSGVGKSSILKMIYGSYRCDSGQILVRDRAAFVDVVTAAPRRVLAMRRQVVGYVSQFLRAVPRVPAIDVVAEPLARGSDDARSRATEMLQRLGIPERLWSLPPSTFSGGEQQRVNIASGFVRALPLLLLDEPTASLDGANRDIVVRLIDEKKRQGTAIVAIVHDDEVRNAIVDRVIDVQRFAQAA